MDDTTRINTFINTLREANSTEPPDNYNNQSPTEKLITLTRNIYYLAWDLASSAKQNNTYNATVTADIIKYDATNIINICVAELEALGHTSEAAIEFIATDGALWFWSLSDHPLNKFDQDIPPIERIQYLHAAAGQLTEWWPIKTSPLANADRNNEIEQAFVNLAYDATCAIIAHNH